MCNGLEPRVKGLGLCCGVTKAWGQLAHVTPISSRTGGGTCMGGQGQTARVGALPPAGCRCRRRPALLSPVLCNSTPSHGLPTFSSLASIVITCLVLTGVLRACTDSACRLAPVASESMAAATQELLREPLLPSTANDACTNGELQSGEGEQLDPSAAGLGGFVALPLAPGHRAAPAAWLCSLQTPRRRRRGGRSAGGRRRQLLAAHDCDTAG